MIEINLVPANLRKNDKARETLTSVDLPKEVLFGLGGVFLVLLLGVHVVLLGLWVTKLTQQSVYKSNWEKMVSDKNTIDATNQELKELKKKISVLADITSKKAFLWSEKLNILSDSIPKGVWLKKISWNNKLLTIEGYAISNLQDEITIVGNLVSSLKKNEGFAQDFSSIELNYVNRIKMGTTEVSEFKITAKVK